MKTDFEAKYFKPRPIPFALYDKIKTELARLVEMDVIKPVKSAAWATPIVPVLKPDGSIRICADYNVTVNPQIEVDRHPIPRIEELFHKLRNGQWFTKIDLKDVSRLN